MDSLSIFNPRFSLSLFFLNIISLTIHMKIGFASFPLSHELVVTITNNPLSATLCGLDGIFSTLTWPRNSRYSASKPYVHGLLSSPLFSLFRFAKSTISAGAYSRLLVSNTLAIIRDARVRVSSPHKFSIFTRSRSRSCGIYLYRLVFQTVSIILRAN